MAFTADSRSVAAGPSAARRRLGGVLRALQRTGCWRRFGRWFVRGVRISGDAPAETVQGTEIIRLEARRWGRSVGQVLLISPLVGAPDETEWWIFGLLVPSVCRRLGLGEALLRAAVRRAEAMGIRRLDALVNDTNAASLAAFAKAGFAIDEASSFPAEFAARHKSPGPYVQVWRAVGAPEKVGGREE